MMPCHTAESGRMVGEIVGEKAAFLAQPDLIFFYQIEGVKSIFLHAKINETQL